MGAKKQQNKTVFCFAYPEDLDQAYAFYCARYDNIEYDEFLKLGFFTFKKKLGSIPETEPLYKIIQSRTINIGKIKDKDQKRYWQQQKKINRIPSIYLSNKELDSILINGMNNMKGI